MVQNIFLRKRKEKTTHHQRRYQDQNDHQFLPFDRLHRPAKVREENLIIMTIHSYRTRFSFILKLCGIFL